MDAQIINMQQWKEAHKPSLFLFDYSLACFIAWQRLMLSLAFPGASQSRPK